MSKASNDKTQNNNNKNKKKGTTTSNTTKTANNNNNNNNNDHRQTSLLSFFTSSSKSTLVIPKQKQATTKTTTTTLDKRVTTVLPTKNNRDNDKTKGHQQPNKNKRTITTRDSTSGMKCDMIKRRSRSGSIIISNSQTSNSQKKRKMISMTTTTTTTTTTPPPETAKSLQNNNTNNGNDNNDDDDDDDVDHNTMKDTKEETEALSQPSDSNENSVEMMTTVDPSPKLGKQDGNNDCENDHDNQDDGGDDDDETFESTRHANDNDDSDPTKPTTKTAAITSSIQDTNTVKINNSNNNDYHRQENGDDSLCEYEKLRLRNIERNNARLVALGLTPTAPLNDITTTKKTTKKKKKASPKKAVDSTTSLSIPTRRSGRLRKPVISALNDNDDTIKNRLNNVGEGTVEVWKEPEEVRIEYTVSPLLQYSMDGEESSPSTTRVNHARAAPSPNAKLSTLSPVGPRLCPPKGLGAIYSLEFWSPPSSSSISTDDATWLVGAGKSGIVALWDTASSSKNNDRTTESGNDDDDDDEDASSIHPVLSWTAHSGRWISGAKFLPTTTKTPSRLVTSSNDGTVCLWDLTQVATTSNVPKLESQTGKGLHKSGIFAMDVLLETNRTMICTGSKDKTVAIHSVMDPTTVSWRSEYHSATVKAVQWQGTAGSHLLASASDDGYVAIHDYRTTAIVAELGNAHAKPHSVVWDKFGGESSGGQCFMTAGLDPTIKLWDLRKTNEPLSSFQGHVPSCTTRCKRIHHPAFFKFGASSFVLTGGERSNALSMFQYYNTNTTNNINNGSKNMTTSSLYSRGNLPVDCGDAGSIAIGGNGSSSSSSKVAVSVEDGEVLLLDPQVSGETNN